MKAASEALERQMKAVQKQITSNPNAGRIKFAMGPGQIREHLFSVNGLLEGSDDAPTAAATAEKQRLEPDYQAAIQKFNQFLQTDVAAFNREMAQHKLTGVIAGDRLQP